MHKTTITLDGATLTRAGLVQIALHGAGIALDVEQLEEVHKAAEFIARKARDAEPVYGVTTGFGSNADKFLGDTRARDALPGGNPQPRSGSLLDELQYNLIVTHAVCVGAPFAPEVVRAMIAIRVNTLMKGHSGIRPTTLQALADLLNHDVIPVIPQKGSVGASGDLAPLSHLAIVLLGEGEAFHAGERLPGAEALRRAGLQPVQLSYKEGLALNNGTAQMLATATLALHRLEQLIRTADLAAAMSLDAFAGRTGALQPQVHALRPHPGQVAAAENLCNLLQGSTLADIAYHRVPRFRSWQAQSWDQPEDQRLTFDLHWDYVPPAQRRGKFYSGVHLPFRGGKKAQPQDAYCLRCAPQVHGAVRDAFDQACRVIDIELNAVTDNPLIFRERDEVISAGHFHGMPLALAMSYIKAAIPVLASISERRLNKLVDPATNDGLPAFLIGNEDGTESGFMIVQYTAAALVNDLATRAHPASVYSVPTSANAEDHVSMGANEARHVLEMVDDLSHVLALEIYTAAQALELRLEMLQAARRLAERGDWQLLAAKVQGAPAPGSDDYAVFAQEVNALLQSLREAPAFQPGDAVRDALAVVREVIPYMTRDRAMDGEVQRICELVRSGRLIG
jgi:histidine ammonia-lyase